MKLEYTFYIQSSIEDLWNIITTPEGTKQIFYGAKVKSSFIPNDPIKYIGPGRDGSETLHIYGTILESVTHNKLVHTSNVGQVYKENDAIYESRITYILEDQGFAIKLSVIHDQWDPNDPSYENTKGNWWLMLANIKTLAETGKALQIGLHE